MRWNGYKAALSLTFDDGLACQLKHAIPAMDARGIKGTFFLPTDAREYPIYPVAWRRVADNGHEIGSHSATHRKAAVLSEMECQREAVSSKRYIREALEVPCDSFCYPYTDAPEKLQREVRRFYKQARGGRVARLDKYITKGDGVNLHNVPCFHVNGGCIENAEHMDWIYEAIEREAWIVLMLHGVGEVGQWDNVPMPEFEQLCSDLFQARILKQVWTAPFGTVADFYRKAK
jgi:peptidoglycan/xylan/chitin deacetylase (PgdA/CDA1 family)